ncbi:hypothetical protein GOODEAATRI_012930, partial [Goodea atripinnis]
KTERYSSYPVYHSVYETFEIVEKFYDPTFRRLRAVAQVRIVNDQLMYLERAFIDPLGLPGRPFYRHVIFAPSSHNKYAGESFPGIYDALFDIENSTDPEKAWQEVKRQISIAAFTVNAAAVTLTPPA